MTSKVLLGAVRSFWRHLEEYFTSPVPRVCNFCGTVNVHTLLHVTKTETERCQFE
jgi:hypothetical protein